MQILEAYDLTGSLRQAAVLAGCDHKTVAYWVALREQAGGGGLPRPARAKPVVDGWREKVGELVDRSRGHIRADKVHAKLVAMGYAGSERTTRRAVAVAKAAYRKQHGRRYRPWLPEPGLWMQWDYGDGPVIDGRATTLFCAWLAWSRYRVVVPLHDRTMASVIVGLDRALRRVDGCPTYALTDNEKTVTVEHVCGIAVRNPTIVQVSRHYGMTIATCVPYDPESKGGSEATVRIAKADLLPSDHNLRPAYRSFAELEDACERFMAEVNAREHRSTARPPVEALAEEHEHLHRLPRLAPMVCFGQTRTVSESSTISVGRGVYSVPSELVGERVWAREEAAELVVVYVDRLTGPREVARHALTTPGRPAIKDEHYPPRPEGPLQRTPRARSAEEREFLAIGPGAERWLTRAAAEGTQRIRRKMAEAVDLARLHGADEVGQALDTCTIYGRFSDGDLASVLCHQHQAANVVPLRRSASEDRSLQRSTRAWEGFGR